MPLRAPAHLTPLPELPPQERRATSQPPGSPGSAFDTPRPQRARPRLRDIGSESGEETALAPSALVSATMGAGSQVLEQPLAASEMPPALSRRMRLARRRRHIIWALCAAATLLVAVLAYRILAGG